MVGLRPFTINIVLILLFVFFIGSFALNFIQTTNPTSEVLSDKYGLNNSVDSALESISSFSSFAENIRIQMASGNPTATDYLFLIFKGAFYIPYSFLNFIYSSITTLTNILFPALGGTGLGQLASISMGVLFASFLVTIVVLIVKAIRTGESER